MWFISFCCLVFVAVMCVVGTLSKTYDDNLLQRVGMALICLGVLSRANEIWYFRAVPPELLVTHIGLALFAAGTMFKTFIRHFAEKARLAWWAEMPTLGEELLRHVKGGKR